MDFADLVQPQLPSRQRAYRISPLKCRDLAATLEFEIVWEVLQAPSPYNSAATPTPTSVASPQTSGSFAGRPPSSVTSSMLNKHRYGAAYGGGYGGGGGGDTASVTSSRRTLSSQGSEHDLLADLSSPSCGECRATKRRMERKEVQILQLESFLKESQKRIDSLVFENEELVVRETAETKNANLHRALNMRMLQELEMAFQFCATQMRTVNLEAAKTGQGDEAAKAAAFMFLPQFEFMERVKQFHLDLGLDPSADLDDDLHDHEADLDEDQQYLQSKLKAKLPAAKKTPMEALQTFDFRMEMDTALERNQRLQRQLEFINRAMSYEQPQDLKSVADSDFDADALTLGGVGAPMPRLHRAATNTSATTSGRSSNSGDDPLASSQVAPVLTMTEQINLLERENFLLKAKLESTASKLRDFESVNHPHSETSETTSTSSQNSHMNPALSTPASSRGAPQDDETKRTLERIRDEKNSLAKQLDSAQAEIDSLTERLEQASLSASAIAKSTAEGNTAAPGFLNKIYMDVGKAKIVLEEKVKQLNQQLTTATEEKTELQTRVNELELQLTSASASHSTGDNDLEAKLADFEQEMMNQSSQMDSYKQELIQAKQRLNDKQQDYNVLEKSKLRVEKELESVLKTLLKAQDECTNLETQVESLQQQLQTINTANSMSTSATAATPLGGTGNSMSMSSVSSLNSSFIVAGGENRDEEVMELSKQLKLSKQEVMQLRYRSNQLESVHEKLEEALKEKRTLQVKLTALEGQLYEHRSRSINDNSFASSGLHDKSFGGASANNAQGNTDTAMIVELQRQLDQKSAQLLICQRELEMMRRELMSAGSSQPSSPSVSIGTFDNTDLDSLTTKVTAFEGEIARLRERNEDQATRLEALDAHIAEVIKERTELENIVHEMIAEMDQMTDGQVSAGAEALENDEYENKTHASASQSNMEALMPVTIADRYAAANSNNSRKVDAHPPAPVAPASPTRDGRSGSGSKIAHLIKNFSNDENSTSSANRGDFRNRNASTSSNNASVKGSFVGAMASRFQQKV